MQVRICEDLDLTGVTSRNIDQLSGGELQRFAIAICCIQNANVYMFDEPSSYLDVKQRLKAGTTIRGLLKADNYVVVVEHDLAVLDYLSDFICVLYGVPGESDVGRPKKSHFAPCCRCLWCSDIAVGRARRHQCLPRRLHTNGEYALPRHAADIQSDRSSDGGGEALAEEELSEHEEDTG